MFTLFDNQDITKIGMRFLIEKNFNKAHIEEVSSCQALDWALDEISDGIIIINPSVFESTDIFLNKIIKHSQLHWIAFGNTTDLNHWPKLNAQNVSILLKNSSEEEIVACLKYALRKQRFVCYGITNLLLEQKKLTETSPKNLLTSTELEILKLIAIGKSSKEIASIRFLSVHTVTTHKKNIFKKIKINTAHEATKYALSHGLVDFIEYYI